MCVHACVRASQVGAITCRCISKTHGDVFLPSGVSRMEEDQAPDSSANYRMCRLRMMGGSLPAAGVLDRQTDTETDRHRDR